jgi:hypothetical protein
VKSAGILKSTGPPFDPMALKRSLAGQMFRRTPAESVFSHFSELTRVCNTSLLR